MSELTADVLVVGGGLGGVAGALAALRMGRSVILTESGDWLGGQLTTQAVPPDENPWIETTGGTATYRRLRQGIRDYYRRNYPLSETALATALLNPGQGGVSPLCHEPRVAVAVIDELLAPYRASRMLRVLLEHRPISVDHEADRLHAVTFADHRDGGDVVVRARYVLDATELGDLLDLGGIDHVVGAESQADTGEPHALPGPADPSDQQAITWCFAVDYHPDEDHTIDRPEDYDFWRGYRADFWPGPLLGWDDVDPQTLQSRRRAIFDGDTDRRTARDFWHYRRIVGRRNFTDGRGDVTLVNWPMNDYWLGPLVGVSDVERDKNVRGARNLALGLLYWMQTEAPRHDGGTGYPGLRLRGDLLDGPDGLAKEVYVRESRRIKAEFTVLEQHVGIEARGDLAGSETFADSVGTGYYRIDLHPSTGLRTYVDIPSYPFQIPLGALLPVANDNLLPANKNIGTTHITNGCYRLHPVEWNIGEAAGALAAFCLDRGESPRAVREKPALLEDFQRTLTQLGFDLAWPEAIRTIARV